MKTFILNEMLDEHLVKRINEYLDGREDNAKVTLVARVAINVPVCLPVYKNGDYSGSNIYEDMLDCADEYLGDSVSLRRITAGIHVLRIETETREPEEEPTADISNALAFFNMSSEEWEATPPSVQQKLRAYVYTKL